MAGKGGGKDRVRKGNMEWDIDILGRIDDLIASCLGEIRAQLLKFRPNSSKNDTLS
jgi:hypothetical protein